MLRFRFAPIMDFMLDPLHRRNTDRLAPRPRSEEKLYLGQGTLICPKHRDLSCIARHMLHCDGNVESWLLSVYCWVII